MGVRKPITATQDGPLTTFHLPKGKEYRVMGIKDVPTMVKALNLAASLTVFDKAELSYILREML